MSIRPIVLWPDNKLIAPNRSVDFSNSSIKEGLPDLLIDLRDTLNGMDALGIAAPQLGINLKVMLVVENWGTGKDLIIEMINPRYVSFSTTTSIGEEGCLSFPGELIQVPRSDLCTVEYYNSEGELKSIIAKDLLAREIQHEMDHLIGKTLADYVGGTKRDVMKRRLAKMKSKESGYI